MVCSINLTKFDQIMTLGPKMAPPQALMFNIGLYSEKHKKIFLSETIWPRLFDLILYVISTIFQLKKDGSPWVEPVLS